MINKKSLLITCGFCLISLSIIFLAEGISQKENEASNLLDVEIVEESSFDKMDYFSLSEGKDVISLKAKSLRVVGQRDLYFTAPEGVLYNDDGDEIAYTAREGKFKDANKELTLEGDVNLKSEEGSYNANKLYYNGTKDFLEARGDIQANVRDKTTNDTMRIKSNYMSSWLNEERSLFIGDVSGKLSRDRVYEGSFIFSSERLELNRKKSQVSLSNNVYLERNNYNLRGQRAEIFLENFNKKLKYYVLYDDIKLVEELVLPDGTKQKRRAFAEKLEGYMSQGKIVLTGAPRVEQGEDLIKGYQITLRENVELVEVEEAQSSFRLNKKTQ